MPKTIALLIAVIAALAAAVIFLARPGGQQWTSTSDEAVVEFELGLEAQRRYYTEEAIDHFRKAVQIDSDFAIARLFLLRGTRYDKNESWARDLKALQERAVDDLTSTESFLLRYGIANLSGERDEAKSIVAEYLEENPTDPFALDARCDHFWRSEHVEEAELCYKELLEVEPNWVQAENRLGYLAMSQARFDEAEEHFRTYRYIAPDQANPHDSLAELLILVGRYEEAESELLEALEIRPDFCGSYRNFADLSVHIADLDRAEGIVDQAAEHCGTDFAMSLSCTLEFGAAFLAEDWAGLAASASEACVKREPGLLWLVHRGTVLSGELRLARKIEKAVARLEHKVPKAIELHLKGVRLLAEGKIEGAASSFEGADRYLGYGSQSLGMLKLFNRLHWARAHELKDRQEEADKLVEDVAGVNPAIAESYRNGQITMPGP